MPSTEDRYKAAIAYVTRAIDSVERAPANSFVDTYAARLKTEVARGELARIESRWLRASDEITRAAVARDAELLADRTQESLPGAPQDRQRTNLWKGEPITSTSPTSFVDEVDHQAGDVWRWAKDTATTAAGDAISLGTWALVAGGIYLGVKLYRRGGANRDRRPAATSRRALNDSLSAVAESRSADGWIETMCPFCHRYKRTDTKGRLVIHENPSGGVCSGSGRKPLATITRVRT